MLVLVVTELFFRERLSLCVVAHLCAKQLLTALLNQHCASAERVGGLRGQSVDAVATLVHHSRKELHPLFKLKLVADEVLRFRDFDALFQRAHHLAVNEPVLVEAEGELEEDADKVIVLAGDVACEQLAQVLLKLCASALLCLLAELPLEDSGRPKEPRQLGYWLGLRFLACLAAFLALVADDELMQLLELGLTSHHRLDERVP